MAVGKVFLIGAGPGNPDLLTLRALRAIRKAEVLICDNLLPRTFFDELGLDMNGKIIRWLDPRNGIANQGQINQMMLKAVRDAKTVARIKIGDPHIFGRGQEEQVFLTKHQISWELIPGLSVASVGPALLDRALTSRNAGKTFAVVSARCAGGSVTQNFPKADSLIIFMGVSVLGQVVENLLNRGWNKDTPALMIERATMAGQKHIDGRLSEIPALARQHHLAAPAILLVGQAAEQNDVLKSRPKILFTGLDPANFRNLGVIIYWPAIKIQINKKGFAQLPGVLDRLKTGQFRYVIFTSKISARYFFNTLRRFSLDSRVLAGTTIIAAGNGTAEVISEYGITADIVAEHIGSAGICTKLDGCPSGKVLIIQSATAMESLATKIATKLGETERLSLHYVVPHPALDSALPQHDIVYFTCPSAVRAFWQRYGKQGFTKEVWCIGEVTLNQLKKLGVNAKVVRDYVPQNQNTQEPQQRQPAQVSSTDTTHNG